MHQSEQINELAAALAKAQGAFVNPQRNREVKVRTKAGDTYTFAYATLDAIMDMVRTPLASNGLALVHALDNDEQGAICETRLIHGSGQWLSTWVPVLVAEGANAQGWGAAITYARRYGLCSLLGIAADEDDDGNAACGNEAAAATSRPARGGNGKSQQELRDRFDEPTPSALSARRAEAWRAVEESEKPAALLAVCEKIRDDKLLPPETVKELLDFGRERMSAFAQGTVKKVSTAEEAEKAAKWYGGMWLLDGEQKTNIVAALGAVREGLMQPAAAEEASHAGAEPAGV